MKHLFGLNAGNKHDKIRFESILITF